MIAAAMFFQAIIFILALYSPYRPKPVVIAGYFAIMFLLWGMLIRMSL